MKIVLLVIVCSLLFPMAAISADGSESSGAELGVGNSLCSSYMVTYEHNPQTVDHDHDVGDEGFHHEATSTSIEYIRWLEGYLSAYNIYENDGRDVAGRASVGGMLHFLYQRCSETPDAEFISVIPALLERIKSIDSNNKAGS